MARNNKIDSPNRGKVALQGALEDVTSIFSIKPMAKYMSGARCVLRMNGKIIGFAFGISWKIETSVTEIRTIDDYMPYELSPKHITVDGTINGFRIPGAGPTVELLQTDMLSFLHQRYIEIEVRDAQTDNLIFLTKRALITSRNENIKSNQLADMTLNFKAIGWQDERIPNYPDGYNKPDNPDDKALGPFDNLVNKVKGLF